MVDGAPEDFLAAVTEQPAEFGVCKKNPVLFVADDHAFGGVFDEKSWKPRVFRVLRANFLI